MSRAPRCSGERRVIDKSGGTAITGQPYGRRHNGAVGDSEEFSAVHHGSRRERAFEAIVVARATPTIVSPFAGVEVMRVGASEKVQWRAVGSNGKFRSCRTMKLSAFRPWKFTEPGTISSMRRTRRDRSVHRARRTAGLDCAASRAWCTSKSVRPMHLSLRTFVLSTVELLGEKRRRGRKQCAPSQERSAAWKSKLTHGKEMEAQPPFTL